MIPGEWVEATARAIWGEEVPVVHEDAGHWTWHETEGVYTPPHMGVGSEVLPYPPLHHPNGGRLDHPPR